MSNSLPLFHVIAGKPVIVLGEGEAGDARRRLVERAGGLIVGEDNAEARLAFVALDEPEEAVARLKARGLLVNATDRPEFCDFTVPSLLERGPVQVAVGTGGVSAGLAKWLRLRLEALLPQSLGALAEALGASRATLRQRYPSGAERRRALDAALQQDGPLDPLDSNSASRVADWLAGATAPVPTTHEIYLRSANPDDLSLREARQLGTADLIYHDANVSSEVLVRARADAVRIVLVEGQEISENSGTRVILRAP